MVKLTGSALATFSAIKKATDFLARGHVGNSVLGSWLINVVVAAMFAFRGHSTTTWTEFCH